MLKVRSHDWSMHFYKFMKIIMSIQNEEYPDWAKMPEDYDFSHSPEDLKKYESKLKFRTDAVWEKFKLLDFFRVHYKIFRFDKSSD